MHRKSKGQVTPSFNTSVTRVRVCKGCLAYDLLQNFMGNWQNLELMSTHKVLLYGPNIFNFENVLKPCTDPKIIQGKINCICRDGEEESVLIFSNFTVKLVLI